MTAGDRVTELLAARRGESITRTYRDGERFFILGIAKPLVCRSGLKMSVQASETHYCTPRNNLGPWTHFEIGFPSEEVAALLPYAEEPGNPTGTVYGWVPAEVIEQVIADNGGLV
jgi:hypothetical protein